MQIVRVPDTLALIVEGSRRETWLCKPPANWQHQRTYGGVLAFFLAPSYEIGVSCGIWEKAAWIHASIVRTDGSMPTYDDMVYLKESVFGPNRYAAQIMPPESEHVNLHSLCLHLWGPFHPSAWPLPKFGEGGSI